MTKIKYDLELIKIMPLFESVTGAKLKDAISGDSLIFIVQENEIGKAIGKNGANVRRVENMLKKNVKIVEFRNDVAQFARNVAFPFELKNVEQKDGVLYLQCGDTKTRGMLIGRDRKNINFIGGIIKRYFDVKEIKVV